MTRTNFLVFGAPQIEEDEIAEVVATLRSGWIGTGPRTAAFEQDFSGFIGASQAVGLNSCTAALHLSLIAAGVGPGDEVITTPLTFCATVNAIIHSGATPVLADIDPVSMNIDPRRMEAAITPRTKAVLPVHFAGRPCDMDAIMGVANRIGLKVVEDCAHAIEAEFDGRKMGSFGDFGCFSFYVTKNVTTGEGGMVITRRAEDANRIKVLALHGMSKDAWHRFGDTGYKHYLVEECGFKYNMTDLQAAIGLHQLRRVEKNWEHRRAIWQRYDDAFREFPIGLPEPLDQRHRHAHHLYTVLVDRERTGISRDEFLDGMTRQMIGVGVHYLSIPEHPYYQRRFGWRPQDFPEAMRVGRQTVSLPLSPQLNADDVGDVIAAVKSVLRRG